MTGDGGLVEVQATAERTPLSRASLDELLSLYRLGGGPTGQAEDAAAAPSSGDAAGLDRVAFLVSRPDLPRCLSAALERM